MTKREQIYNIINKLKGSTKLKNTVVQKLINTLKISGANLDLSKMNKQVNKILKTTPPKLTRNEQRLKKAIKLYPVGTKFTSIYGTDDVVTNPPLFMGKKTPLHWIGDDNTIMVSGAYNNRIIYDNGSWAKIHK